MKKILTGLLAVSMLFSGCSTMREVSADVEKSESHIAGQIEKSKEALNQSPIEKSTGIYLAVKPVKETTDKLPEIFDREITYVRDHDSVFEFAEKLSRLIGIPVKIQRQQNQNSGVPGAPGAPGAGAQMAGTVMGGGAQPIGGGMAIPMAGMAAGGMPGQTAGGLPVNGVANVFTVRHTGTLKSLLDAGASRFGFYWKYAKGEIRFFEVDSKTFEVASLGGDSKLTASVESGSSSSGGTSGASGGDSVVASSGSASQVTSFNVNLSVWSNIESSIKQMLSPSIGRLSISPALGTVTVTDTPAVLEHVAEYMENLNRSLSRQVMVNVQVLSVTNNRSDNYGIQWGLVGQTLNNTYGLNLSTAMAQVTGAAQATVNLLQPTTSGQVSFAAGSKSVIQALSTQGKVAQMTSSNSITLNNQPVPVQVGTTMAYLASVSTTSAGTTGSGPTVTMTPGTIRTGFDMTVLPRVLDDSSVMLQMAIDISSLTSLNQVSSGGNSIQTPEIEMRRFIQKVSLKSGQTLILSGFEQNKSSGDKSGIGSPDLFPLGGNASATKNRESVVVIIQPVVLDPNY